MQKIKNPILCWIVILAVFIRPTPAQAFVPLAAVAVGAVIAATGVMVAGAGVYKPPTFAEANAAVDSVTGDITRKVVVARAFADGLSSGLRGFGSQYTLDFPKVAEWVKNNTPSFPSLSPAVSSSWVSDPFPIAIGNTFSSAFGNRKILTIGVDIPHTVNLPLSSCPAYFTPVPPYISLGGGVYTYLPYATTMSGSFIWYTYLSETQTTYHSQPYTMQSTTDPLTPVLGSYNPSVFAAAYPNTQAGQDETDKIAADYPAAIKSEPQEMTPDQIADALKQIESEMSEATAVAAEAAAAADPTNTALQIAAQQARLEADKDSVIAEAERAKAEVEPEEETDTPPPAGPALDQDLQVDLSPFLGLQDKAMSKFPFSMVSSLGSLFSGLTSAPVTPSMDVPMPWGIAPKQITLSHWDDFAGKWRMMIAFFFHASCIYAIIRRYS